MRLSSAFVLVFVAACACERPAQQVELPPAPSRPIDDGEGSCEPEPLEPVGVDESGALDTSALKKSLEQARDFAQRCCNGDAAGTATVIVTVQPEGYGTEVVVEPDRLAEGPTGSCLHGSFHRVATRPFKGVAMTVRVPVRVKP